MEQFRLPRSHTIRSFCPALSQPSTRCRFGQSSGPTTHGIPECRVRGHPAFHDRCRLGTRAYAASAVALFWGTPPVWTIGFAQVADVLVAYCVLAVFAVLASQLPGNSLTRLPAALGGFCLGLLCWSKMEGVPLALALMGGNRGHMVDLTSPVGHTEGRAGHDRGGSSPRCHRPVGVQTPLGVVRCRRPEYLGVMEFSPRPHRALVDAAARNLERPFPWRATHGWSYVWTILMVGAALGLLYDTIRRSPNIRFWALSFAVIVTFWVGTYAIAPYDQAWQLATSLDRLMLQAYPLAVAGVGAGLGASSARAACVSCECQRGCSSLSSLLETRPRRAPA